MDDTEVLAIGRVRWFDSAARRGVITGVGGSSYLFDDVDATRTLDVGQVVTFQDMGRGPVGQIAAGVRPVTATAGA